MNPSIFFLSFFPSSLLLHDYQRYKIKIEYYNNKESLSLSTFFRKYTIEFLFNSVIHFFSFIFLPLSFFIITIIKNIKIENEINTIHKMNFSSQLCQYSLSIYIYIINQPIRFYFFFFLLSSRLILIATIAKKKIKIES